MAPRVFLLCVCFTVGLLTSSRSLGVSGLDLGLELTSEPEDVIVTRSKSCTLECSAVSSLGPVSISWTHNGQPLNLVNDSRRFLLQNGSLHFKKVVTKKIGPNDGPDQGEYRCIATAANSVVALVSRPALIRVANLSHEFIEFPTDQTVEEGTTVRFACQIDSIPNSLISWEKDQKSLPQSSRYTLLNSGVLFISASQPIDAGAYRCVATNPLTKKQRSSVEGQLAIISRTSNPSPPTFLSTQTSLQIISGNNFTLECGATGSPLPKLTWVHKSQTLNKTVGFQSPNITVNIPGLNVLSIQNAKSENSGNYTCSTLNGKDVVSRTVNVTILVPPTFKIEPSSQVYPTAKTVRFKCEAEGVPTPEIKWYKDGAPLKINGRIKQHATELLLSNTVTDDSGLYQCVAKNVAGEIWAAGRLLGNASRYQPEPPHDLRCRAKSATQVELSWQEPDARQSENKIKAYTIHHLPTAGGEERQEVSVNRSIVVEKLMAYTNYTFYARAYSGHSASDQSARVVCQTDEKVPLSAPLVSAEPTSPTTLRVWWKPVPVERARGLITEYKIQWRRSGHPSSNVDQVKGDVLDYTIIDLHPSEEYEVRVLAATSQGWPELPDEQLPWTKLTMPSDNASNATPTPIVHLIVVNATSIEVTWSLPLDVTYKPSKYHLYYRQVNNKQIGPIVLKPSITQYLLSDLEPGTKFEVHVAGWREEGGEGSRGVTWIYTLPGPNQIQETSNQLEPPTLLDAEPTGITSINLTWSPPPGPNNASYYEVCYNPVGSQELSYIRSTSHGVEITSLKSFTQYEFKVRSHDHQNRHGPYSRGVECSTLGGLPGPVKEVNWQVLNTSTIRIGWKSPEKTNGAISAYVVTFSADLSTPLEEWKTLRTAGSRSSLDVSELSTNVRYYLTVRAESGVGLGAPSSMLTVTIPLGFKAAPVDTLTPPAEDGDTDRHLGMVVGVIIGLICVVVCALALVLRKRCTKSSVPEVGGPANGNGCCRERRVLGVRDAHELELLADTSVHIPPTNHAHLDTKGGGCYPNGQANGLANGRMPNGHVSRDRGNVHITENPQYARRQEHRTPLLDTHTPGANGGPNDSCNASTWTQVTSLDSSTNSGVDLKPPQ